jgi:hypothetical protein
MKVFGLYGGHFEYLLFALIVQVVDFVLKTLNRLALFSGLVFITIQTTAFELFNIVGAHFTELVNQSVIGKDKRGHGCQKLSTRFDSYVVHVFDQTR